MHCREHVVQLHRGIDRIRAAGGELHVIGNGSPTFMQGFRDETGWDGPLYTDPSLEVFAAAGMKRGVMTVLRPTAAVRSIRTLARGFKQGRTQGDPWQQGGVLVVMPDGEVRWRHASGSPGDNASIDDIERALKAAA
jgi:hypothetical protein